MAISKITLNGVTQMDVTQKSVTSGSMLNGVTALKNDGTDITGNIQSKTSSDLTVSGATVTAPAGNYASAASKTIPDVQPYVAFKNEEFLTIDNARMWRVQPFAEVDAGEGDTPGYFANGRQINGDYLAHSAVPANTSITPTESVQTVGGSKYMMEGAVTVNAIPSNYVGSGITQRSSSDLTTSGATVTAPAGYYGSAATKTIPNADVTVGNPSFAYTTESGVRKWGFGYSAFTETAGYIGAGQFGVHSYKYNAIAANTSVTPTESSQTIGGADTMMEGAVTVNAIPSNYIGSGITQRSSSDLTNSVGSDNRLTVTAPAGYYSTNSAKTIQAASATVSLNKSTVSNHQITVSATKGLSSGYLNSTNQITTDSVSVSASELVSGTKSITSSGTTDVTNYASASVAAGSATTPATTITANPSISVSSGGLVTATASATQSVTPTVSAGFVSSGTAGTVAVSGSNTFQLPYVTGTFTGTTAGAAMDVSIPYTGSGYPITIVIYPTEGCFNENGTFYNTINRYACAYYVSIKTNPSETPTYTSGTNNNSQIYFRFKASSTTASTLDGSPGHVNNYANTNAAASAGGSVKIKDNTTLSVYIKSTSYGFAQNVEYTYYVIYSS